MASMNQEIQNVQNHQDEQRAFNVKLRKVYMNFTQQQFFSYLFSLIHIHTGNL